MRGAVATDREGAAVRSSPLGVGPLGGRARWLAAGAIAGWIFLGACDGDSQLDEGCCGASEGWNAAATWPSQGEVRADAADAAATAFDRSGTSEEIDRRLIDGLRGVALTGVEARGMSEERDSDPWRARLLRRSPRVVDPSESISVLEAELLLAQTSDAPGALVREAAIRANLAHAIVLDAQRRSLAGEERIRALISALDVLGAACQVPEAILNAAAIHLELARVESFEIGSEPGRAADERSARSLGHLREAEGALWRLVSADAASCEETRGAFFGVEGRGARFAYVLDKSASMSIDDSFGQLAAEVSRTLEVLPDEVSFAVLFFSEPTRRGGQLVAGTDFTEMTVEQRFDDGTGMFKRGILGDRGSGGGIDALLAAIAQVQPDGHTQPAGALRRAIELAASSIFLLTDGAIETDEAELVEIADAARANGTVVNSVLFIGPGEGAEATLIGSELAQGVEKLRLLAQLTGGTLTVASKSQTSEIGTIDADALGVAIGVRSETILQRMKRRGYWTPEAERQYQALLAEALAFRRNARLALGPGSKALEVAGVDIVTQLEPLAVQDEDWPRVGDGNPAPRDPAMIFEMAILAALAGETLLAQDRFEAAALVWADCAARAGGDEVEHFCDLACRSLLMRAMTAESTGGFDPRSAEAAQMAYQRAVELGVARTGGWNALLLAAGAGVLSNMKLGVQGWMRGDDPEAAVEIDLVRSYFRRSNLAPANDRFAAFPTVERQLFCSVADRIRSSETQ
jgi:hypothetical protein